MSENIRTTKWISKEDLIHPNNDFFDALAGKSLDELACIQGNEAKKEHWQSILDFDWDVSPKRIVVKGSSAACDVRLTLTQDNVLIIQFSDAFYILSHDNQAAILDTLNGIMDKHEKLYPSPKDEQERVRFFPPKSYLQGDNKFKKTAEILGCTQEEFHDYILTKGNTLITDSFFMKS